MRCGGDDWSLTLEGIRHLDGLWAVADAEPGPHRQLVGKPLGNHRQRHEGELVLIECLLRLRGWQPA